jgi:DNA processing protein
MSIQPQQPVESQQPVEKLKDTATRLALLPWMTPKRLRTLLSLGEPSDISAMLSGWSVEHRSPMVDIAPNVHALLTTHCSQTIKRMLGDVWCEALRGNVDLPQALETMDLHVVGRGQYPQQLNDDQNAPPLLYSRGNLELLSCRRVGIVGTRNATEHGRSTAFTFGKTLAQNGVAVVSGLARGIDAAAHRGVLAALSEKPRSESTDNAGPIAVVATGLDMVYPREHHSLWAEVGERGLLLSENPPGTGPLPYRFPLRNRIIAALSEVLLVVESRLDGGSLITVREALERGVTVMAVPGATSTKAAQGTNMLIRDGALVAIEPEDVLVALGLDTRRIVPSFDARQLPLWPDSDVLDLITTDPLTLNEVARLAGEKLAMSFGDVAVSLGRLEAHGWVMCTAGWFERVGAR